MVVLTAQNAPVGPVRITAHITSPTIPLRVTILTRLEISARGTRTCLEEHRPHRTIIDAAIAILQSSRETPTNVPTRPRLL